MSATLADFLLARIAEEETHERDRWLADIPDVAVEAATAAWDRLTATAWLRFSLAVRQLGVALLVAFGARGVLRHRAQQYADHPDYRAEWAL